MEENLDEEEGDEVEEEENVDDESDAKQQAVLQEKMGDTDDGATEMDNEDLYLPMMPYEAGYNISVLDDPDPTIEELFGAAQSFNLLLRHKMEQQTGDPEEAVDPIMDGSEYAAAVENLTERTTLENKIPRPFINDLPPARYTAGKRGKFVVFSPYYRHFDAEIHAIPEGPWRENFERGVRAISQNPSISLARKRRFVRNLLGVYKKHIIDKDEAYEPPSLVRPGRYFHFNPLRTPLRTPTWDYEMYMDPTWEKQRDEFREIAMLEAYKEEKEEKEK